MQRPFACVIGDLSLVRALGRRGVPVALVTADSGSAAARSRYCAHVVRTPSWVDEPQAALAALLAWARTQREPPVVFYQGDHDLLALSRARAVLNPAVRCVLPPAPLVEDLVDKLRFAALAELRDLPVPATRAVSSANARQVLARFDHFPCVLKPAYRTHWFDAMGTQQKALRIESRFELERLLPLLEAHVSEFVLQALIEGGEDSILSYHAYVRAGGEIVAEFTGQKLRTVPRRYGISTFVEVTDEPDVRALGRSTVERLGFSGVLKIDFKRDTRDGRLYLLEINPRFNLWHHPGTLAGVPIPELVYQDCVEPGSAVWGATARAGVRWVSARQDLRGLSELRAARELSMLRWAVDVATADVNEDFCWRDPLPAVLELTAIAQRRLLSVLGSPGAGPSAEEPGSA